MTMRTTLAIDDDVFAAAKELATRQSQSVGQIISALARQALRPPVSSNGIPLLPVQSGTVLVTPELVNQLSDELP
jgi:hypothetical protein